MKTGKHSPIEVLRWSYRNQPFTDFLKQWLLQPYEPIDLSDIEVEPRTPLYEVDCPKPAKLFMVANQYGIERMGRLEPELHGKGISIEESYDIDDFLGVASEVYHYFDEAKGERSYKWLKALMKEYPDSYMSARMYTLNGRGPFKTNRKLKEFAIRKTGVKLYIARGIESSHHKFSFRGIHVPDEDNLEDEWKILWKYIKQ